MSVPPHYVVYRRRFGLFRRFWWFAIGAGAAALWIRHHERETPSTERRRFCSHLWRRDLPPAQQPQTQTQTPPPYAYDWAAHRPGLQASMPEAPAIPHASESHAASATPPAAPPAPAPAVAAPAIPTSFPAPPPTAEEERRRRERDREELEHRAREYAADKLERLSAALDRLREGLRADVPRDHPVQEKETRWV